MPASAPARPSVSRNMACAMPFLSDTCMHLCTSTCGGGISLSARHARLTRWRSFAAVCVQASTRRATERRTAWRARPGSTQQRHCRRPHVWIAQPASTRRPRATTRRPTAWRALQVRMHVSQSCSMRTCTSIAIPFPASPSISLVPVPASRCRHNAPHSLWRQCLYLHHDGHFSASDTCIHLCTYTCAVPSR